MVDFSRIRTIKNHNILFFPNFNPSNIFEKEPQINNDCNDFQFMQVIRIYNLVNIDLYIFVMKLILVKN